MSEREPQPIVMAAVVRHCKGETWMTVPKNIVNGALASVQLKLALEHDNTVHKNSEPCHKSFFTR